MPDAPSSDFDAETLLRQLIGGSPAASDRIRSASILSTDVALLVAAALLDADSDRRAADLLDRAATFAATTRDRQLVAIAAASLAGDDDRFDALVRDHLVEHPDHVLVAWIAAEHERH